MLFIITAISLAAAFFYLINHNNQPSTLSKCASGEICINISDSKKIISEELEKDSPENVYLKIKQEYSSKPTSKQHDIAHLFGQLLYQKVGNEGIAICDRSFSFGCFHGLFIAAISDQGIGVTKNLDETCIKKFGPMGLGCQHGIGHGIAEYLGPKKLILALELCGQLSWQKPLLGCAGGVFMEHNLPLKELGKNGFVTARKYDDSEPYGDCNSIPERYKQECFFDLGLWWNQVLNKDYSKMMKLCKNIENDIFRHRCLMGVGTASATTSSMNVATVREQCGQTTQLEDKTTCLSGAAWVFSTTTGYTASAQMICEDLAETEKISCQKNSDLIKII